MKVQLVVVQGKPEGKTIPLAIPQFKIGRGEGCQLRPNNDQVSREHSMFELGVDTVSIQDLNSRNGTEVNGKKLSPRVPYVLKNGDLVKIGPLTFAVSIEGVPAAAVASTGGPAKKPASLDDVGHDEIDAWLVSDAANEPPDRPSGVYGGDTITINALKSKEKEKEKEKEAAKAPTPSPAPAVKAPAPTPAPAVKAPAPAPVVAPAAKAPEPEPEPEPEVESEPEPEPEPVESEIEMYSPDDEDDGIEDLSRKAEAEAEMPDEMIDESNPFYVKKPQPAAPTAAAAKAPQKDSSDAAGDILRKLMDRRKASKSS